MNITLQQMQTLDAVVSHGSIQAGARHLNKTHPSVIAVLKKLEDELGFALFDRSGYRSVLTEEGKKFHQRVRQILGEMDELKNQVTHLRGREEGELNIVVGDITPLPEALAVLRTFSREHPYTRLNLFFGNLFGPNELLLDGDADLIVHHVDKADSRYEYRDFCKVQVVPVVAPGFLDFPVSRALRYADLENHTQCIIRDTSTHSEKLNRFVLDSAPHLTVGDQYTKKEVIVQGMGWGHMPLFLVEKELNSGKLISIAGKHIKGITREIVIARLSAPEKGIMAERLWQSF
jgi:DNA-binding transcriptional LysR family regulator